VASFDDDSYPVNPDYFALVASEFEKYPHAAVLGAVVRDIYFPEGPPAPVTHRSAGFVGCGCVYRRSAFLSTSGFVPLKLAYGMEEVDLSMRLYAGGDIILQSSRLVVQHDTDMTHRFTSSVNAAVTSNAALLIFLRYPVALWPMGLVQFCKIVVGLIREGRSDGILSGIFNIPSHLYRHRQYRKTLTFRELTSFISLRRRYAREMVPA
jgi:GT2 family glycosyltransferase